MPTTAVPRVLRRKFVPISPSHSASLAKDACREAGSQDAGALGKCVHAQSTATAYADPQRVRQILRNLFTNAARYGGPHVEVRFGGGGTEPAVTVADDGAPIESSRQRQIFDPYTSAHESSDQLGSIGLGLFISLKLARLMGGDLRYRHDGTHVLFELFLPTQAAPKRIAETV